MRGTVERNCRGRFRSRRIAGRNYERSGFLCVVEDYEDAFFVGLAQEDVRRVVREEMPEFAGLQRWVLATEAEDSLYTYVDFLLLRGASFSGESVIAIFFPAAGKIVAIVGIGAAGHGEFIAVVEFGNSSQSGD